MKKSIAIGIIVTLVIGLIAAIPVFAGQPNDERAVFESDILETANHGTPLEKGEVWVRADGSYKVEIEGVEADEGTTYDVTLRYGFGRGVQEVVLGQITIDEDGEGLLEGWLQDEGLAGEEIRSPTIRIDEEGGSRFDEMANGFYVPVTIPNG